MTAPLRLLVTSIVRNAELQQASGFVRVIDFMSKRTLMKSAMPESIHRAKDPNPRGGLRGARGASVYEDRLVIANAERLLVFNPQWELVGEMTHLWMGGIHDILAEEDGVWVACTNADLLVKVDWTGKVVTDWEWRLDHELTAELGFRSLPRVDRSLDYRDPEAMRDGVRDVVHLNAVNHGSQGLLLSFGRILSPTAYRKQRWMSALGRLAKFAGVAGQGSRSGQSFMTAPASKIEGSSSALVLLNRDRRAKILKLIAGSSAPNHNVIEVEKALVYNDSNNGEVVVTALDGLQPDRRVAIPGQFSFPRGLVQLDQRHFLVGSHSPAALYQVDIETGQVVTTFLLDGEPTESVYGICLVPPAFHDPPAHL